MRLHVPQGPNLKHSTSPRSKETPTTTLYSTYNHLVPVHIITDTQRWQPRYQKSSRSRQSCRLPTERHSSRSLGPSYLIGVCHVYSVRLVVANLRQANTISLIRYSPKVFIRQTKNAKITQSNLWTSWRGSRLKATTPLLTMSPPKHMLSNSRSRHFNGQMTQFTAIRRRGEPLSSSHPQQPLIVH